jgi:hypothetical protein
MKPYDVIIKATIVKTVRVHAETETEAIATAHEIFTLDCEQFEDYAQDTIEVTTPELITGE